MLRNSVKYPKNPVNRRFNEHGKPGQGQAESQAGPNPLTLYTPIQVN